jgi:outer membrane protein
MRKISIFIVSFITFSQLFSQEIKKLSLTQCFDLAMQNSQQLKIDSLKQKSIEYKKMQSKYAMLPNLNLSTSYSRLSDNIPDFPIGPNTSIKQIINQFSNRISLNQPIFQGLKNWNTIKAFELQRIAMDYDKQKDEEDIKLLVVQNYFSLYKLYQSNTLLDSNIAQTQVRIEDLKRFKDVGLILNNDVMRAELQKTNLLFSKADIESAIQIYNFNLCVLLGLSPETKIEVEQAELINKEDKKLEQLIDNSLYNRPELKAQDYRIKASDYQIKIAKAAYIPIVSIYGNGYENNPNQRLFPPQAIFKASWDVGISLNWNITQLITAHVAVNDAENQRILIQQSSQQLKDGISMEVNANFEAVKVALLKIDLAQKAIEQATENRRILNNRFQAQVALLNDVLEADQLLLQAQTNLLNAKADAAIANYKLQKSLGESLK